MSHHTLAARLVARLLSPCCTHKPHDTCTGAQRLGQGMHRLPCLCLVFVSTFETAVFIGRLATCRCSPSSSWQPTRPSASPPLPCPSCSCSGEGPALVQGGLLCWHGRPALLARSPPQPWLPGMRRYVCRSMPPSQPVSSRPHAHPHPSPLLTPPCPSLTTAPTRLTAGGMRRARCGA